MGRATDFEYSSLDNLYVRLPFILELQLSLQVVSFCGLDSSFITVGIYYSGIMYIQEKLYINIYTVFMNDCIDTYFISLMNLGNVGYNNI
jgi:hypothetical protein